MNNFDYLLKRGKKDGIEKNVVGAIISDEEGRILILSRKKGDFMGGIDELPSGNMEQGEDIAEALRREVKEETNCSLEKIMYFIDCFDYKSGSGKKARQYNFAISAKGLDNIELTEHDEYKWQTISELLNNPKITEDVKKTVSRYIDMQRSKNNDRDER